MFLPMHATSKLISTAHPSLNLSHPTPDRFTWNTIIRFLLSSAAAAAAATTAPAAAAFSLYSRMRLHGARGDSYTFPFLFLSLSSPSHLLPGQQLHSHILHSGLASHPFVSTSLISMYSNCGSLSHARHLFDEIPRPDLPSWNAVISAHLKSNFIDTAYQLFVEMPRRNVVSWSCMIDGFVKCGDYRRAIELFREMQQEENVKPNAFTLSSALSACAGLGALEHGKWVHAYIDRSGMVVDTVLGTSLIDMYAKCGAVEKARRVFDDLGSQRDVLAWSAMIAGLAMHGRVMECVSLFEQMQASSVVPNAITFLGVLCACVHGGLVDEGAEYFKQMSRVFGIVPQIQHYGCIVDLYARAGLIDEAWNAVRAMPMKPDVLIWGALLSGSRKHGDIETCEYSIKQLIELEPMNSGAYVLLSNAYAKMGRWDDVRRVRNLMEEKRIKKIPGCSLVELEGCVHEFFAGDESHPETREIYWMLEEIMERLKFAGYVADTREALIDMDEEGKQFLLLVHSEKIAIAFCLMHTRPGTEIRITKNLRMCLDCHAAIKLISRIYDREITIRDCNRFHQFRNGFCSCEDFW